MLSYRTKSFYECLNVHNIQSLDLLRPYLEHDVFRNTFAALAYTFSQVREGTLKPTKSMLIQLLSYRGEALSVLRKRLDDPNVDEPVLLSILFFIMLEVLLHCSFLFRAADNIRGY